MLFRCIIIVMFGCSRVVPWVRGQTAMVDHSIILVEGLYGQDNDVEVDSTREYILSFPNTSTANPYRITAHVSSWTFNPAFIVVRQPKMVLSWQIPMMVSASDAHIPFSNTARTLCFGENVFRGRSGRNRSEDIARNFSISLSTSSPDPIAVTIRADEVYDYYVHTGIKYSATISASEPVFYYYKFPKADDIQTAFIVITSEDDICLVASIQDPLCPVRDLNQDIKFEGSFQTVNKKGGMFVSSRRYPDGFFLVFVAMGDNSDCSQESSILPMPRHMKRKLFDQNRTSVVQFTVRTGISRHEYIAATMLVLGLNLGFALVFIAIIAVIYCIRKRRGKVQTTVDSDDESYEEDIVDTPNVDIYLQKKELTVHDFSIKSVAIKKKSFNYFWHITNIGIFYGIPVVQLMVSYQRTVILTGDLDMCYHNFLCAHPLADVSDFNHIYSNIGYVLLGILFLIVTLFTQKNNTHYPKCGIPRHYGIFYAMGVALILEGLLSACYHICPNQSNYQFDTSFMYVMTVLCMVKLYQNRHPRINASAYATFTILGAAVFLAMIGILTNSTGIMIIFVVAYMFLCIFLSFKIYFMGYVITGVMRLVHSVQDQTEILEAISPIRKGRFILLAMANLCNVLMAVIGIIFYPSYTDFGTYLLGILMANGVLHATFYISMKLIHKERICIEAIIYTVLCLLAWGSSGYFFIDGSTMWSLTPAQSRQRNTDCIFMNFYDDHDVWHLLSAPALFFTFMMLMHLDDDLAQVPRTEIIAF